MSQDSRTGQRENIKAVEGKLHRVGRHQVTDHIASEARRSGEHSQGERENTRQSRPSDWTQVQGIII